MCKKKMRNTSIKETEISLNIVMTYPVKWSKYNVFRDFIQNFYDSVGCDE